MTLAPMLRRAAEALWLAGGMCARAELGLADFDPPAGAPFAKQGRFPHCSPQETNTCPYPCSNSSHTPPSR
jgi:hypothetical protein